jgi:hypothetical protein
MMALAGSAGAVTHYVSPGQSIQTAIDDAIDYDEIEVAPGTYTEAINFDGKAIRLYSTDGPNDTTIDANGIIGAYHVVQCVNGEDANTILEGFTITGGDANGIDARNQGGGMYNRDSSPTVKSCIFTGNSAGYGGGMLNDSSSPTITDCNFIDNTATDFGGGIENYDGGSPTVTNCLFSGNTADDGGGMMNNVCSPTVTNCLFSGNTAEDGGGIHNLSSSPTVTNCTFTGNTASNVGGGMYSEITSSPILTNCILWNDTPDEIYNDVTSTATVTYSDVQGVWAGTGNIDADPLFVNAAGGDLRLSSDASLCIDAGDNNAPGLPATDLAGNPRFVDGNRDGTSIVDMGAYEFQGKVHNITRDLLYEAIQSAIDDANDGDQIETAPGTYYEAINFKGKAVRLYSSGGPAVTTIDATGLSSSVVSCASGEGPNTILDGFTITGGTGTLDEYTHLCGGGMRNYNSSPTVTNCTFTGNSSSYGGGMYNYYSTQTVTNCTFSNNFANQRGGGMYNSGGSPTVTDCTFSNNSANQRGGGMCNSGSSPMVTDCTFIGNSVLLGEWDYFLGVIGGGGGMYNDYSIPTVTNCTFTANLEKSGGAFSLGCGGGMFNYHSYGMVTDCTFSDNESINYLGGGMFNKYSNPTVTNCTFSGNSAGLNGGGMCNSNNSSPTVTNCNFSENEAYSGGGMFNNNSSPTVINCSFSDNTATDFGGGIENCDGGSPMVTNCLFSGNSANDGGGMYNDGCNSTVTDCIFKGNTAEDGGGMMNNGCSPTVTNCTFSTNAGSTGGGMYNDQSEPIVTNCILWGDTPDEIYGGSAVTYCDVQGGWPGEGNINISPHFVDAGAGDLRLTWYSPCVDAGDNNAPCLPATDLDGNPRVMDGDGDGNSIVDMGAYELEAGMFKVGIGTLTVTIEPNETIDAGAKWKVEGGDHWYNSGDVVTLPPGYHKVEVNELPDWSEPETLLVGYDTVDSNEAPQQTLWVRVIGDMNATATAEYKPLPVFDIGQIPPRDAPHDRTLEFHMDANWLGDDVLFSFEPTFDPNYPEPEGPILIDPVTGLFTYEPNDVNDRTAFIVTFRAESVVDVNEQAVKITPIPDLPLEYEILSRPVHDLPDPCDHIFVNEILSDEPQVLNGIEHDTVRSVTITGKLIFIEDVADNPVYVYDNNLDINDLTIFAETVVISDPLHLPQINVTIYARELIFEGLADINTTPIDLRAIPPDQETDGLRAGNISLYIESYDSAGGLNGRLIMGGTKGYYGGSPGEDGILTCTLDEPLAWLNPYALKMVIAHARDTYLYRYTAEIHDILSEYAGLLSTYRALPEWNDVTEQWQFEFEQMHQEIITLLHRIDNGLDYFGNPPDWVPALSFEVLYTVYEQEIDHAIRVMYLSYWLQNKADDISKKEAGLSNCRSQLWEDTVQARDDYYTCKDLIGPLKARANSIASRIGTADGECYGLLCDLKNKEADLLKRAERGVHEANKVPWLKTAGRALATIGTSMIKGAAAGSTKGPKGAAAGVIAGGVVGTISALTDDSIMNPNPWPQASMRTDVAKQFRSIDFEQATEGWMDDFNDIEDLSDIEEQGVDVYLQNLRDNAGDMADGMWDIKEALKTTLLYDEEVEAKLKEIKATDPTFNSLVDDVTELIFEKQVFNRQLAAAMQKIATLSNSMTNNVLAIDAMNRDASHLNRIVDPKALMYLKDMESRALARLRKYHYYLAKAYEYRLLEPYFGDLNIDEMFNKMKDIATTPLDPETDNGRLGPQDFEALKVIYEDELKQLTEHILNLFLSGRIEKNVPTWFAIYDEDELRQINAGEPLTVNLFEEGLFPSDRENIRIVDMKVEEEGIDVSLTGDCNGFGQIVANMQHPAVSKLQYFQQLEPGTENIYQFRHLAEDTKDLLDINWKSEYNIINGQLSHPELSASQESLLWTLLGDHTENALIYSRPGAWADITITKRDNLPKPAPGCPACQGDIDYLLLRVEYDYYDKKADLQTLHVATWPIIPAGLSKYELLPYFLVDTPDDCGRQDGIGNFYRIYNWYLVPEVTVTAPETYGNWRFDKWTDISGYTLGYGLKLEFEFLASPDDNPTIWAEYVYEGPILSITDFDEDYDVDFEDYAALSRVWSTQPTDPEWDAIYDVSDPPDDVIDKFDLKVLCENWLATP